MADAKTRPGTGDVAALVTSIVDPAKRADAEALMALMGEVTDEKPVRWGTMIGFGRYHYRYASGHEGDTFEVGFAARKTEFSIYLMGEDARREELLGRLGKHRMGKGCLYLKRLADVDLGALRELIEGSVLAARGSRLA